MESYKGRRVVAHKHFIEVFEGELQCLTRRAHVVYSEDGLHSAVTTIELVEPRSNPLQCSDTRKRHADVELGELV